MRVVGGQYRGRSIIAPQTRETRPTMDRTREAIFNILLNSPWAKKEDGTSFLQGAVVIDVFAGSGAYGLEALSHRAQHVTFFEQGPRASDAIEQNVFKFDVVNKTKIMQGNVLTVPVSKYAVADIAFFDPPYGEGLILKTIDVLGQKGWLNQKTLLVIETEDKNPDELPSGFQTLFERSYGRSKVIIGRLG